MLKRMAKGLRNSPPTFQRIMYSVLSGLLGKHVLCFLNGVIIASKNSQENFSVLSQVLLRFEFTGLKLKLRKCALL